MIPTVCKQDSGQERRKTQWALRWRNMSLSTLRAQLLRGLTPQNTFCILWEFKTVCLRERQNHSEKPHSHSHRPKGKKRVKLRQIELETDWRKYRQRRAMENSIILCINVEVCFGRSLEWDKQLAMGTAYKTRPTMCPGQYQCSAESYWGYLGHMRESITWKVHDEKWEWRFLNSCGMCNTSGVTKMIRLQQPRVLLCISKVRGQSLSGEIISIPWKKLAFLCNKMEWWGDNWMTMLRSVRCRRV